MKMACFQKMGCFDPRRALGVGVGVCLVVLALTSCKKWTSDSCEKACVHATEVVLDMVASQGTLNTQAVSERSAEMQLSCQMECREGGRDPDCLLKASSYGALQECSAKAPDAEGTATALPAAEAPTVAPAVEDPSSAPAAKPTDSGASGGASPKTAP